jgi:hypothetical protein
MIQQLELDIFKLAPASRRLTSQMRNHAIKEIHHGIVGQEWGRNNSTQLCVLAQTSYTADSWRSLPSHPWRR